MESNLLQVTYAKSCVGYSQRQKDTIRTLGLSRLGETVIVSNSPSIRGMLNAVSHLVEVEPVGEVQVKAVKDDSADKAKGSKSAGPSKAKSNDTKSEKSKSAENEASPSGSTDDESDVSDG